MIGGLSWESSALYYKMINEGVRDQLGGNNAAKILICSVNFAEIVALRESGGWDAVADVLGREALKLEKSGADCLIMGANTVHIIAEHVEEKIRIPLIHIVDTVGKAAKKVKAKKIALTGTIYTMEGTFFQDRLKEKFQIETIIPRKEEREEVHRIIFDELTLGIIKDESKIFLNDLYETMKKSGAEAAVLGCTELGLLTGEKDLTYPVIDSAKTHAAAAVTFALADQ